MSLEGKELGRYHLHRLIGSGGMGEVYLAEDTQVRRQVAIKVIKIEATQISNEAAANSLRLFQREATAIARLDHPHILPLYDHGEHAIDAIHYAYLVTPFRAGGSLVNWLQHELQRNRTSSVELKTVEHIVQQAASALQYAHNHQVIHQDVKPANFLIRNESNGQELPELQLADFGIAHLTSGTSNVSQSVRGTPLYMAPEQWTGSSVFASDQYSLAIMVYELLTGTPPFQGAPLSMMYAHLHDFPRSPRELNPQLPPAIETILRRALAKKPEERFESIGAFARAFQLMVQESTEQTYRALYSAPVTPIPSQQPTGDRRATLSISADEARSGTVRSLTLSGGRSVTVQIPPGVQQGHVITLAGMGDAPIPGGTAGNLYLSLSVIQTEKQIFAPEDATATLMRGPASLASETALDEHAPTYISHETPPIPLIQRNVPAPVTPLPTVFSPPVASLHSAPTSGVFPPVTSPAPLQPAQVPAPIGRRRAPAMIALAVVLVLLVLGGSFGVYYVSTHNNTQTGQQASSTQTTRTTPTTSGATATATSGVTATTQPTTQPTTGNTSSGIWQQQNSGTVHYLTSVTWAGSQFLAAGYNGTVLTSPDGLHWTSHDTQHPNAFLLSAGCFNSVCVVIGTQGVLLTSQDKGHTWVDQSLSTPAPDLRAIISSNSLSVIVGTNGTILVSSDDLHWQKPSSQPANLPDLSGVRWTGSMFVAVGDQGTIVTSPDGYTWTRQNSPTTANLKAAKSSKIQNGTTVSVIVGEKGTILTSTDGVNWTTQISPASATSTDLTGVTWGKSQFVISGVQGLILTSPDGQHWTKQQSGTNQDIECAASNGKIIVLVGIGGLIITAA